MLRDAVGAAYTLGPDSRQKGAYRVVLEALAHLLAVCGQHEAVADQVLEGGALEQQRAQHHERVEPAPGLIQPCACNQASAGVLLVILQCHYGGGASSVSSVLLCLMTDRASDQQHVGPALHTETGSVVRTAMSW